VSTSARKNEANRANAQRSTGPTSDKGKATSSRNALKHGLTSKDVVIHPDHQVEFDDLVASLHTDFAPAGAAETVLFHQIVTAMWRLLRCDRVEAELAARTTEPDPLLDPELQPTLRTLASVRKALKQQRAAIAELRILQSERIYREQMLPKYEATGDNKFWGLANIRTLMPKILKEQAANEDAALMAAINAPPPGRYIPDEELDRRAAELLRKSNPNYPAAA
jgi:hypothetical protein